MDALILVGRMLFALFFLMSGVGHITKRDMMTGYAKSQGVPAAGLMVLGSGALLLAGGVMVAVGIYGDLGALLLVAFLIPTSLMMHAFWKDTDSKQRMDNQMSFMRNVSLLGATLLVFVLFAHFGHAFGLTVTKPLWTIR